MKEIFFLFYLGIALIKKLCVSNMWIKRKRKVTIRPGENETVVDIVLIRKELCFYMLGRPQALSTWPSGR